MQNLTRTRCLDLFLALSIVAALTATLLVGGSTIAHAAPTTSDSMDIQVDHAVQIRNGGLIVINDTVKLFAEGEGLELESFALGIPFIYRSNLDYVFAYDASISELEVKLDAALGKIGFYGVEVGFPQSISISSGAHYEFTVVFVFSNSISSKISPVAPEPGRTTFNATFPAYPGFSQTASEVNLTIALTNDVKFLHSSFENEGIDFTNRTTEAHQVFNYTERNLSPFAYKPSWFAFEGADDSFQIIEAKSIERDIAVDTWKHVLVTDSYNMVSRAVSLSNWKIQLLPGASEVSAWDKFGNSFEKEDLQIEPGSATTPSNVILTFSPSYIQNESARFTLTYSVPWENVIIRNDWWNYRMSLSLFEDFNLTIRKLAVTITLPEGAELTSVPDLGVVQETAFEDIMHFVYYNVTPFHDLSQEVTYEYSIFWTSFRPTLWAGTAMAVLGVLTLLWRAPRPIAPIPTIPVRSEELKSYVDAYEQKRQNLGKLETLEERARKRKVPRRRYRVRKRTLESRLLILSKDIGRLRDKLQVASPKYADMMRQIEIAEADIEGIEAGIRRTETRYRRGEISTAAYHKLLEDYYRRREKARTTIDGILIRLREDIA